MGSARTVEAKAPERSPAATLARAPVAAAAARPSSAAALQRRLGNSAVVALAGNAASLAISSPGDPAEREAARVAAVVAQPARPDAGRDASAAVGRVGPSVQRAPLAQPQGTPRTASPALRAAIDRSLSGGSALSSGLRAFMEPRLGASLAAVRIHTDETAATLSRRLNARAFTVGNHVFFGRAAFQPESVDGRGLIAHELAHVLQQGGATPRAIQRDLADNVTEIFDSLSPEQLVRRAIKSFFPELGEMIDKGGVAEALSALAADGAERLFAPLRQPLEGIASVGAEVAAALGPTVATLQAAGKQIAQNDCTPIRLASERIEATVLRLLTPVVEKVQPVVARVEELLAALWQKFGAPILDWIKSVLAEDWAALQKLAGYVKDAAVWLWDKTEDTRDQYARHWAILKNLLGIGDAPDGRNGILQWVEVKLGAAWDRIKARLAPYTTQLKAIGAAVAGVLLVFSPAGPILALGAAAAEVAKGIAWVAQNWGKGNILVTARNYVEKTLLPPLAAALDKVSAQVARVADSLATSLGSLAASLAKAVASLGEDAVAVVVRLAQWLADQVQAMAAAVNARVAAVRLWLDGAFDGLVRFLRRVKAFLGRVADVAIDIYALPLLLGEKLWDAVPACLRDPFVDFFGKIIVGQVELFSELVKDDEAWKRTKDEVAGLIRQVFHTKDLVGAIKAGFLFVLRIFNLPPDLLAQVAAKAMAAWETVARAPLAFLRTTIRALGEGFRLIWDDRLTNLKNGLRGWLLGEIKDKNLVVPDDWTNTGQVFDFVLSLLGLSVDHVLELVEKRFPGSTEPLRKAIGRVQKVMEWVHRSIDVTKSPKENAKGMLDQAKTFGLSLLQSGAEWIIGKVAAKVTQELAKAAGTAGFGALLTAAQSIYAALVTARKWMRQILDMADKALDSVIDLAAGAVAKVGTVFAGLMKQAMPVVIGFLADQVGLGDVGRGLGKAIEKLRAEVDKALLWLIDKIAAGIRWLIGTGRGKGDVREEAATMIRSRLPGPRKREEIGPVLSDVLAKLKSRGLKALEMGAPGVGGISQILAEASPKEPLLDAYRKDLPTATVKLAGTVRLTKVSLISPVTSARPFSAVEAVGPLKTIPGAEPGRFGGAQVVPRGTDASEGKPVEAFVTWNTNSFASNANANTTHAERQFVDEIGRKGEDYLRGIEEINLHVSHSACTACTDSLVGLAASIRRLRIDQFIEVQGRRRLIRWKERPLILTLNWNKLYFSPINPLTSTTKESLELLRSAGWTLEGPWPAREDLVYVEPHRHRP